MTKVIVLIVGVFSVLVSAQAPDLLDLTAARPIYGPNTAGTVVVSGTGISSGGMRSQMPLSVMIESMDRDVYQEFDAFSFRIRLQNVGDTAVTIPWNPNANEIVTDVNVPVLKCLLTFTVEGLEPDNPVFPIASLYGSTLSPGTLKVFQAGGSAQILGEGTFRFLTDASASHTRALLPRSLNVRARIAFLTSINGRVYNDLISNNRVPIVLNVHQRR